jgi:uncharacterized protein
MPSFRTFPEDAKLDSRVLIAGFHGIGATGYWSIRYLIQELKAKKFCYIDSEYAPAIASTVKGEISTPYEVFVTDDLALLKADVPPLRENETKFFRELGEWIIGSGLKEVALIGGLDESLRTDDSKYRVVLTSAMAEKGDLKDELILEEGRIIVGPVAVLLNSFEMLNFPAYALLAFSNIERVDPRASATAVEFLSKRYGFQISIESLIRGAEELEKELMTVAEKEREKERSSRSAIYT